MRELLAALRPIKRRLRLLRLTGALGWLLALTALAIAIWQAVSFLTPIEELGRKILISALTPLALGSALALLWPVPARLAAQRADRCGLQERAITALEGCGLGEMGLLQLRDAVAALGRLNISKAMPVKWRKAPLILAFCLCLIVGALTLLPNPQDQVLKQRAAFERQMAAQAAQVEKLADGLNKDVQPAQTQELKALLRSLERSLQQAKDRREVLSALDKTERELNRLRSQMESALHAAAQALRQAGLDDVAQALEGERLGAWTDEALAENAAQAAAQALSQAAGGQKTALAQSLASLAASASAAQGGESASALTLGQALRAGLGSDQLGQAGAQLSALRQAALGGGGADAQSAAPNGGSDQRKGEGGGLGGGAGKDSANRDGGRPGGSSQGAGGVNENQDKQIKNEAYERIYDPGRLGGSGRAVKEQGQVRQGESLQVELGPGEGSLSGTVPYGQVVGEYAAAETRSAQYAALTPVQQSIVNSYYAELTK